MMPMLFSISCLVFVKCFSEEYDYDVDFSPLCSCPIEAFVMENEADELLSPLLCPTVTSSDSINRFTGGLYKPYYKRPKVSFCGDQKSVGYYGLPRKYFFAGLPAA